LRSVINTPVDTAIRTLCSLGAAAGIPMSLDRLRLFDMFVVFSGDVGGPGNVHPDTIGRLNGYNFREEYIVQALELLVEAGVVEEIAGGGWVSVAEDLQDYLDGDGSRGYVGLLSAAARWLTVELGKDAVGFRTRMIEAVRANSALGMPPVQNRFQKLEESWVCDLSRLAAIEMTAKWIADRDTVSGDLASRLAKVEVSAWKEIVSTRYQLNDLQKMLDAEQVHGPDPYELFFRVCGLPDDEADILFHRIRDAYDEDGRCYHTFGHVRSMLKTLHGLQLEEMEGWDDLVLAIFLHDSVYDPKRSDNEYRSAELVDAWMPSLPEERRLRVKRLVLATDHRKEQEDDLARLIVDIDLSVFAAEPMDYDRYSVAVRREYGFVPDDQWRVGRVEVLRKFLERPSIFSTSAMAGSESDARSNLAREIAELGRPVPER
jgi:predicted metal-dependent HD superfamily phosphohydrolase